MIEQKYTTSWKSFREMENFTFIYAENFHDEDLRKAMKTMFREWKKKLRGCSPKGRNSYDPNCIASRENLFWKQHCKLFTHFADQRLACEVFDLAISAKTFCLALDCPENEKFKAWLRRRTSLLKNMASHSRIRPFSRIRKVIRNELLQPRTAFVFPAGTFDTDWKIFEEESRTVGTHFAHSEHVEDFGGVFGYHLTSGFNEYVGNMLHLWGEVLMESGIFWLWKTWEELRRCFPGRSTSKEAAFVELSFRNSDVHLVFVVYVVGLFQAMLYMGAEYLWYHSLRKLQLMKSLDGADRVTHIKIHLL